MIKTIQQIDFDEIFFFAEKEYGINWNTCNDIFFGNSIDYNNVTDFEYIEWQCYMGFWKDESSFDIKASSFTKEEVLGMTSPEQSYLIVAAYLESLGFKGSMIQIDSR